MASPLDLLAPTDTFARRHHGDDAAETAALLATLGQPTLDALVDSAVPAHIRLGRTLNLPAALSGSLLGCAARAAQAKR